MSIAGLTGQATSESYTDLSALNKIKSLGREDNPQAIVEVAKQFESFFIREMLKEMRKTVDVLASDNPLNSNELQFHQQMYDQQLSLELSSNGGIGLAKVLEQQLTQQFNLGNNHSQSNTEITPLNADQKETHFDRLIEPLTNKSTPVENTNTNDTNTSDTNAKDALLFDSKLDFIRALKPIAEKAAQDFNLPANVLLAQAALETGWGKFINSLDDRSSFNLFNIKSDTRWLGESVQVNTLEYRDGVARKENASFRVYDNFEQSFQDYIEFIRSNPRYDSAVKVAHSPEQYLQELQKSGYATDPKYAEKIIHILQQSEFN